MDDRAGGKDQHGIADFLDWHLQPHALTGAVTPNVIAAAVALEASRLVVERQEEREGSRRRIDCVREMVNYEWRLFWPFARGLIRELGFNRNLLFNQFCQGARFRFERVSFDIEPLMVCQHGQGLPGLNRVAEAGFQFLNFEQNSVSRG